MRIRKGQPSTKRRENLREAVELVLATNRELAADALAGQEFTKEPLVVPAP